MKSKPGKSIFDIQAIVRNKNAAFRGFADPGPD